MDFKISTDEFKVKVRANGVILHGNRVLMCSINDNGFWCCPGGHIHIGEDSKTATIRETFEEVDIMFDDAKLFLIMENFFSAKNKQFHEISFYSLMQGKIPEEKLQDYSYDEDDHGKMVHLEFKWMNINDLDNFDVRPKVLVEMLKNGDYNLKHIISKEK